VRPFHMHTLHFNINYFINEHEIGWSTYKIVMHYILSD
jgi:hypothetical protein